ncbi:hypothetical protein [uncultured Winogradskyella sp.]|uniref:hypothetical protein n=1 Tax=uncultured Winogradskyella sp. TaxID=395353 RepID=UPI00261577FE|nr:hypothetical protein [uncultured Winogradskyella sp.]
MKHFYQINSSLIPITILLWFTFWGGMIAQTVLGIVQVAMSVSIMVHFKKLSKSIQILFTVYVILTISIIMLYRQIGNNGHGGIEHMFLFIIVTLLLAFFHLYITYKIKNYE